MARIKRKPYFFAEFLRRMCSCHRNEQLIADLRDRACLVVGPVACWIDRTLSARLSA